MHDLVNINSSLEETYFCLLLSNVGYSGMLVKPRFVISTYINYENLVRTYITIDRKNLIYGFMKWKFNIN